MLKLDWPEERAIENMPLYQWSDYNANVMLDFHGNPIAAPLSIFSDGNHHMALRESLSTFAKQHLENEELFYLTLPPHVLTQIIQQQTIQLGNINLTLKPDVVIGPLGFVETQAKRLGFCPATPFAKSLGNSFLMRKDLNVTIQSFRQLMDSDLRLFISNPNREKASFDVYWESLQRFAHAEGISQDDVDAWFQLDNPRLVFGEHVHHREAPEALALNNADISLLYHHLALRYTRIFPQHFVLSHVAQSGQDDCSDSHIRTQYFISANDTSLAQSLFNFMVSETTEKIYRHHGLGWIRLD